MYQVDCFKTLIVFQAGSQSYAYKFCRRSKKSKGLKILSLYTSIATFSFSFFEHDISGVLQNFFFIFTKHFLTIFSFKGYLCIIFTV